MHVTVLGHSEGTLSNRIFKTGLWATGFCGYIHYITLLELPQAGQTTSAVKNRWRSHFVLSTSNQLPYAGMTANTAGPDRSSTSAKGKATSASTLDIVERSEGSMRSILIENRYIRAVVLPDDGAKIVSLVRRNTGREFLLQPNPRQRSQFPHLGFEQHAYGFDECFPTIAPCEYPEGAFRGVPLPDHGELWSGPWKYEIGKGHLQVWSEPRCLPCIFRKRIRLDADSVLIEYEIESVSDQPFRYLWSAHPLLQIEPGCQIVLPPDVYSLLIGYSTGNHLGIPGTDCGWPIPRVSQGGEINLSVIGNETARTAAKLFTPQLSEGFCAVYYPKTDESISYHFDVKQVPYVGIWVCQGGWPSSGRGHFTAALEPCTGRHDSLAQAIEQNECSLLAPREKKRWELRVHIQ